MRPATWCGTSDRLLDVEEADIGRALPTIDLQQNGETQPAQRAATLDPIGRIQDADVVLATSRLEAGGG
jgi:hypothetical protein